MQKAGIDDVEPRRFGDGIDYRALSDPLDTHHLAINRYRIAPGEGFPAGLHAHGDQEEVFVVLAGEATFETLDSERAEAREITVTAGEAVRFAPSEYQSGRNAVEEDLVALALGAPRRTEDVRIPLDCPECGHGYLRPERGDDGVVLACSDCGTENVPEGCPDCGAEMQVALGDGNDTVVVCPDCGAEAASPFRG